VQRREGRQSRFLVLISETMSIDSEHLPIMLLPDEIDELIYAARSNDLHALKEEVEKLSSKHNCSSASIVLSAVDLEDESEGGTGGCLLHWPAANGYSSVFNFLSPPLFSFLFFFSPPPSYLISERRIEDIRKVENERSSTVELWW
jgi:hypothetical protein